MPFTTPRHTVLNIGLMGNDGQPVDKQAAINAVNRFLTPDDPHYVVHQSDSEATLVVNARLGLWPSSVERLCVELRQDCIASMLFPERKGSLQGPKASEWGAFDPALFVLFNGERAS